MPLGFDPSSLGDFGIYEIVSLRKTHVFDLGFKFLGDGFLALSA